MLCKCGNGNYAFINLFISPCESQPRLYKYALVDNRECRCSLRQPSFFGLTTNRDVPKQVVTLIMVKIPCSDTSLTKNDYQGNGLSPIDFTLN